MSKYVIANIMTNVSCVFYKSIEKCKLAQDIYENAELVQQQLVILNKCNELFNNKKIIDNNVLYKQYQILDLQKISETYKITDLPSYQLFLEKYKNLELNITKHPVEENLFVISKFFETC